MTPAPRGPTGAAPAPPKDLAARTLPIEVFPAGAPIYRVHTSTQGAVFFGPGAGRPPTYRFDPASGRFGVLYAAPGPDAALIETVLRNPGRLTIDWREIAPRNLTTLIAGRPLRLVAALGPNLSRLGITAALSTGPYGPCAEWSDALFDHPDAPDGILFASRHNPDEPCMALFERADLDLTVIKTKPLPSLLSEVGKLLDRHGKSLFGAP